MGLTTSDTPSNTNPNQGTALLQNGTETAIVLPDNQHQVTQTTVPLNGEKEVKPKQVTVSMDDVKDTPSEVKIDIFGSKKNVNDFLGTPPEQYNDKIPPAGGQQTSTNPNQPYSATGQKPLTFYSPIAKMLMKGYNVSLSNGLKWWTKDTSTGSYEIPKDQIDGLADMLAEIMFNAQGKVNPVAVFIVCLVAFSVFPFVYALERRNSYLKRKQEYDDQVAKKNAEIEKAKKTGATNSGTQNTAQNTQQNTTQNTQQNTAQQQSTQSQKPADTTMTMIPDKDGIVNFNGHDEMFMGFTKKELQQGYYFTKKGKKLSVKYKPDNVTPVPKIGKRQMASN